MAAKSTWEVKPMLLYSSVNAYASNYSVTIYFPGKYSLEIYMAFVLVYPLYFLTLFLFPISTAAKSYSNVSLGTSLTASNDDSAASSWISQSEDFAFGFQEIGGHGFLLAIWFNKIPERTIVWSANRNELVQRGSKVELTTDGQLILRDSKSKEIWRAEPVSNGVAYAAMLDSGNFVLASRDSSISWESFDQPTDTILPTQVMKQGTNIIARLTETNYSTGRFSFALQTDGNLCLYTTVYPFETNNFAYWSTQTYTGSGFQVIFNQSGFIYLIGRNGSILNSVTSNNVSSQYFYQRAIIDSDGNFRHYIYPKSSASSAGRWPMAWSPLSFIPSNICISGLGTDAGSGACGYNSYCSLGDDQRKRCQCPPGFSFLDPDDVMKGCKQNLIPHSCDRAEEVDLFEFRELPNTDWTYSSYEYFKAVTEDWCREACFSDCFCAVAFFRNGECWKKRIPLSNGRMDPSIGGKALIKVRKDNSPGSTISGSKKNKDSTLIYILSAILSSSIFLHFLMLVSCIFLHRLNQRKPKKVHSQKGMPAMNLQTFTYKELEEITGDFREVVGEGAFGTVYKGVLATENENFVAVKKLNRTVNEGEQEFKAEIAAIGRTNHKNLVQLLGFCNEGQKRLLVYEFMSNGSLADFVFGNSRPNWYKRTQIAFGTARGLFYLHEECKNQIIHCDIKPQNILLDECLTARISDFGLAKLLKTDQTQTTTAIRGTKGYVAPEWFKNLPITAKVDVFSFGILLLELVCCRKNFEVNAKEECQVILADWAYDCFREGKLYLLVENDEEALEDLKRVEKFVMIAIWCIQEDPSLRPSMKKVTQMIEGAVKVSIPPDPVSFISSI